MQALGTFTLRYLEGPFAFLLLATTTCIRFWRVVFSFRFRFHETMRQCYFVAVESLPVIGFSMGFISLMLVLEFSFHMKLVLRQDSLVPAFSTVLLLRELGPVMACLLLTSRVGAGIAAEIGTMKVTEQIDALKLLSIDPVEYLTVPRLVACIFAAIALSLISVSVGIVLGSSLAWASLGYTTDQFYSTMFKFAHFSDVIACMKKGAVFGAIIPIVASHHGFRCERGSEGVGNAATNAVVQSTMLIIISDFLLTYLLYAV